MHRWLGLPWPEQLDWGTLVSAKLAAASATVASLCGLLDRSVAPLCIVLQLFELKVESCLRFARWLWAASATACDLLDGAYQKWARALMGANQWRNWAICFGELGWLMTGAARVVRDIAFRRKYFWCQQSTTLAGKVFASAQSLPGDTWANCSLKLLTFWGIQDWPEWCESSAERTGYASHVCEALEARCLHLWQQEACKHSRPLPLAAPLSDPRLLFRGQFGWKVLLGHRSLARLRSGFICCGHVNGSSSQAQEQQCILCNKWTRSPLFHVLLYCPAYNDKRTELGLMLDVNSAAFVRVDPSHDAYGAVATWALDIERIARSFWKR